MGQAESNFTEKACVITLIGVCTGKSLSEALLFCRTWGDHVLYKKCSECQKQFLHVLPRFELGIFMYWTCNSMNNLSSHCGLVDAKIRASDKDLPVKWLDFQLWFAKQVWKQKMLCGNFYNMAKVLQNKIENTFFKIARTCFLVEIEVGNVYVI